RARAAVALRCTRHGDRPPRQRLPRARRTRGAREDARGARLPSRPRLRAARGEALRTRSGDRPGARAGVIRATDLASPGGSARAGRRLERLAERGDAAGSRVEADVRRIVAAVRRGGDRALLAFTRRFDGVRLDRRRLRVPMGELEAAYRGLPAIVRRDLAL